MGFGLQILELYRWFSNIIHFSWSWSHFWFHMTRSEYRLQDPEKWIPKDLIFYL